jgi:hypothetical protein
MLETAMMSGYPKVGATGFFVLLSIKKERQNNPERGSFSDFTSRGIIRRAMTALFSDKGVSKEGFLFCLS